MADVIATMASTLNLATRLRTIGKNIENAEFKNLLADLSMELADLKVRVADVIEENAALKNRVTELQSARGDLCPKCKNQSFSLKSSRPHPTFKEVGVVERLYSCSNCGFEEAKTVDP